MSYAWPNVILLHPVWLLLAFPLLVSLWIWRPVTRLLLGLRLVVSALLLLAMSGIALQLPSRTGTVVVVADRSLSMPPGSETGQKEVIDLIHNNMSTDDQLAVVSFGQTAEIEQPPQAGKFAGFIHEVGKDASNLTDAVDMAISLIPRDSPGKVLVLSDGKWTGKDPATVAARAAARGVALDYRPVQRAGANDVAIARLDTPVAVTPGESFMITAWVQAPVPQEVTVTFSRSGQTIAAGKHKLASGLNRLTFRDQAAEPGLHSYSLHVATAGEDSAPENNTAKALVSIQGPRPLLCVSHSKNSGLAKLLQAGGMNVKLALPDDCEWSLEQLSKYSGVIIENVPAEKIGTTGMENLAAWVKETGSGLMMTGGRNAYAPGGYFRSPLEPIMPVSMELRNEHRKLSLGIVVALDRSGSMTAPVGGGKIKMDLADLGTAAVLDLLGSTDEFGVIAVDSAPHIIADLAPVGSNKGPVRNKVLKIGSQGGGIFIYEALVAAAKMIKDAKAGTKHIILFADAADSEQPGNYRELMDELRKANVTVSVIGLGTPQDVDAELLRDIARRGNGRIFFSADAQELPRLFAQDTFVVARSTFLDEPTPIKATAGMTTLTGKPFEFGPPIGGYNLCYLRPNGNMAAMTLDEYRAPVVAAWQAGVGRVLCYTGEADGEYTGPIARWKDVGEFFTSLGRWTAGTANKLPENMLLTQEVKNGVCVVQLHLDTERGADPFNTLPKVTTLRGLPGQKPQTHKLEMSWTSADTLGLEIPLQGNETALSTVDIAGIGPTSLPPVCLPYSPEFKPVENDAGLFTLERLARATGGKERVNVADIWRELPRQPRYLEMGHWLILAAIVLFLLEILERRTGLLSLPTRITWRSKAEPAAKPVRKPPVKKKQRPTPVTAEVPVILPKLEEPKVAPKPVAAEETNGVMQALIKARKKAKERTERE